MSVEFNDLKKHLESLLLAGCGVCGGKDIEVCDDVQQLLIKVSCSIGVDGNKPVVRTKSENLPVVVLECSNCGNMHFISQKFLERKMSKCQ